jgi:hypothetical protein
MDGMTGPAATGWRFSDAIDSRPVVGMPIIHPNVS